jgi:hypothetical protein
MSETDLSKLEPMPPRWLPIDGVHCGPLMWVAPLGTPLPRNTGLVYFHLAVDAGSDPGEVIRRIRDQAYALGKGDPSSGR